MQVIHKDLCFYFNKDGFCVKGDLCHFKHIKQTRPKSEIKSSNNLKLLNKPPLLKQKPSIKNDNNDKLSGDELLEDLWDFKYSRNNNNSYQNIKYKDIVGKYEQEIEIISNLKKESSKSAQICSFFQSGCCTFGTKCRNLHDDSSLHNIIDEDDNINPLENIECGICFGNPDLAKGGQYGLLSGCNCVFCLNCIRGWRKEGKIITSKGNVRLCPLCRNESFFTCPSIKYCTGKKKEILVCNYKQSLANTECKNYKENGVCTFGSSCFYKHGDNNDKMKPKFRLNGNEEASCEKEILLSDLLNLNNIDVNYKKNSNKITINKEIIKDNNLNKLDINGDDSKKKKNAEKSLPIQQSELLINLKSTLHVEPPKKTPIIESNEKNISSSNECCICWENESKYVLIPCGHKCVCKKDAEILLKAKDLCPLCRSNIQQIMEVF